MPAVVLVGAQWGDEGKGKVTDYLARDADTVVRYQGGNNAGHTIVVGPSTYKFHLIPSGMLYEDKTCVLGNGVVIDTDQLISELDALAEQGVNTERLRISDQAHLILPTHKEMDLLSEAKKGKNKIGTTGRGIGPAYRDKVHRGGIRVGDPVAPDLLREKLAAHLEEHAESLKECEWTLDSLHAHVLKAYERLKPHICNTPALINETLDRGGRILFEGAQGTLLDIDHGTYPFVTSSSPTAGGACIGAGIGPNRINVVMGVAKAYATRVGSGPFPSEMLGEDGDDLRKRGAEFGTTTGRARRCGWLDLVALKYATRINGMTHIAITKMDVLDGFEELKICVAYRIRGKEVREFPTNIYDLQAAEPVLESLVGWNTPTTECRRWRDLPEAAMAYISRIEDYLRTPVALVSVGPDRRASFARLAVWEGL